MRLLHLTDHLTVRGGAWRYLLGEEAYGLTERRLRAVSGLPLIVLSSYKKEELAPAGLSSLSPAVTPLRPP